MKVKVYGCRGSAPTSRSPASRFGGNTSCMSIEVANHTIMLDAGSGLAQYDRLTSIFEWGSKEPLDILISHLHLDHLIGLSVFGPVWNPNAAVRIFSCLRGEGTLKEQIFGPFQPPYWPVSMVVAANAECIVIYDGVPFSIGKFTVTPFGASHPDATLSYHITDGEKTLVHLLDSETAMMDAEEYNLLVNYCKDADLVVFDAAYAPVDYPDKKGWGHSTIEDGFRLAQESNCKSMMFSHFSFEYSDQELEILEAQAKRCGEQFFFARDGLEIIL